MVTFLNRDILDDVCGDKCDLRNEPQLLLECSKCNSDDDTLRYLHMNCDWFSLLHLVILNSTILFNHVYRLILIHSQHNVFFFPAFKHWYFLDEDMQI